MRENIRKDIIFLTFFSLARFLYYIRKNNIDMEEIYKKNWETLRGLVQEACNMNPGDTGHGMKKAYCAISKLMQLIEEGEDEGIVFKGGNFVKPVNILLIKN